MRDARRFAAIAVVAVLSAALTVVAPPSPAAGVEDVLPARASGATRLETAVAVAHLAHPDGANDAIIATSADYPDALAGAGLAGAMDAAVLLNPPDVLAATTAQALRDLGVLRVTILGSEQSIGPQVELQLRDSGYVVNRIGGGTLYQTAGNIALATEDVAGGLPLVNGAPTLLLASGETFADALSASGPAHQAAFPLVLTERARMPVYTTAAIDQLAPEQVIIFGGERAVSAAVEAELQARGIITVRVAGETRTDTAAAAARLFVDLGLFDARTGVLARGDNFPDALTAGAASAFADSPILLTATPTVLSPETRQWFAANCDTVEVLQVVGGTAAVSVAVADEAEAAAETCGAGGGPGTGDPTEFDDPTFILTPQEVVETALGDGLDFAVGARYDDLPFTGPVNVAVYPCNNAEVTGPGPDQFADADVDGHADALGVSDTDNTRVAVLNDVDIEDARVVTDAEPGADGILRFTLFSFEPDCAVALVWTDLDGDGGFDVTDRWRAAEPYGVGVGVWR